MRSMYWQLGILGTISAFAYRHRETKKTPSETFLILRRIQRDMIINVRISVFV